MKDKIVSKKLRDLKKARLKANKVVELKAYRELMSENFSKTILVVDDDELMCRALKRILEGENFRVLTVSDGLELSQILESTQLDLLLLDVNLPWVSGFEICELVKSHYALKKIPIILLSTDGDKEHISKGLSSGADDYLVKPLDAKTVLGVIHKLIGQDQ